MAFVPSLPRALFVPNEDFDDEYEGTADGLAAFVEAAEHIKGIAEKTAPVLTGAYRDAFVIVRATGEAAKGRVEPGEILLGNTDFKAHFIEWGTATHPPQATLRRAVQAAGYKLTEPD